MPDVAGAPVGAAVDLSWMGEETREYAQGLFDQADREFQAWTAGYLAEHGHRPTHAEVVAKVEEVAMPQWAAIERFHAAHREVTPEELAYGPHSERAPLPAPSAVDRMTDDEVEAAFARHFADIELQTDEEAIVDIAMTRELADGVARPSETVMAAPVAIQAEAFTGAEMAAEPGWVEPSGGIEPGVGR